MENRSIFEIAAVDSYLINNDQLCYFKEGTFFINNGKHFLSKEISCSKIIFVNDSFYLSFSDGQLYRFDTNNLYQKLNVQSNLDRVFDNQIINIYESDEYDYDNWRSSQNLYDLINERSLIKNNIFGNLFLNNAEIYVNDLLFIKKITKDLDKIWQYNISSLEIDSNDQINKFKKFLGIAFGNLFILSEENRILVLNIKDGSFVKLIYLDKFPNMSDSFMHPYNFHIYCLSEMFVKINSETLEIETLKKITKDKISPEINTILYGIKDSSYQNKYISFTSYTSFRSGIAKWIGLFDYNKEEIVWHYELLPETSPLSIPAFENPQLAENKLYVLDSENTLHIIDLDKDLSK